MDLCCISRASPISRRVPCRNAEHDKPTYQTPCGNSQHRAYRILWAAYPPTHTAKSSCWSEVFAAQWIQANWVRAQHEWCFSSPVRACVALHRPCRAPYFRSPPANTATWENRPYSHPGEPTSGGVVASTIMSSGPAGQLTGHLGTAPPATVPRPHPAALLLMATCEKCGWIFAGRSGQDAQDNYITVGRRCCS